MMEKYNYFKEKITSHDNHQLTIHHWPVEKPKALIHLIHGMSEHGFRYDHFSKWLNQKGIYAYALDLRGHGQTAGTIKNIGIFSENDGWNKVVNDINLVSNHLSNINSKIPTIILGHSMGSFLARTLVVEYPEISNHFIFSATASHPGIKGYLGNHIAKINSLIFGKNTKSKFLQFLVMGNFNNKIKKQNTKKDWISRDISAVENYINDPYCMQIFKNQFFVDLSYGVVTINERKNLQKMDKNKSYLLLSGTMDPVGNYVKGVKKIYNKIINLGIKDVKLKLYDGGRHEMLNEINKKEVYQYIYNWIEKRIFNDKQ